MIKISDKAKNRFIRGIKKFKPILQKALAEDINETDTITIVNDMLGDIFGYDKHSEITSEYAIKKSYCDLAIKIADNVRLLIEVKAIGLSLKDLHIKQAVDYGANAGIDWTLLTNGMHWQVYKIMFSKPISTELVYEFNFCELNAKDDEVLMLLYLLSKESVAKAKTDHLSDFHARKQMLNKFTISQILLSDVVLNTIRRTLNKVTSETKANNAEIHNIIFNDVIRRDIREDEHFSEAKKKLTNLLRKIEKQKPLKKSEKGATNSNVVDDIKSVQENEGITATNSMETLEQKQ